MTSDIFTLIGGVGMFLLGMEVMTSALKEAAGGNLRELLARFTTTPLRGVLTGAAATAVIQSSSATTVMTVGFVGAGLIGLEQALGVLYGANIGTTATGWLVTLLGFRLKLGTVALVALLPASLAVLLGRGGVVRAGRVVAGLGLILVGLDLMQVAIGDATGWVTPDMLPGFDAGGVLLLAGIGLVVTAAIQSSSAAVALALVLLQGGAIGLMQATALIVGMNIGTTFTAILASVGGSRAMRQTAVANLLFNLATAMAVLPLLPAATGLLDGIAAASGPLVALLVFHTGFNLAGALAFLPFTAAYARLIARLVPERASERLIVLDKGLLRDAGAALVAAQAATAAIARQIFLALSQALDATPDYRPLSALDAAAAAALDELEAYLANIRLPASQPQDEQTYSALLHLADHLRRLLERSSQKSHMQTLLDDRTLRRPALAAGAIFARIGAAASGAAEHQRLTRLQAIAGRRTARHRRGLLLGEHVGIYSLTQVFEQTDAMRWFDRVLHHAERIAHYQRQAPGQARGQPPEQARGQVARQP